MSTSSMPTSVVSPKNPLVGGSKHIFSPVDSDKNRWFNQPSQVVQPPVSAWGTRVHPWGSPGAARPYPVPGALWISEPQQVTPKLREAPGRGLAMKEVEARGK